MKDLFEILTEVKSSLKQLQEFLELDEKNSIVAFRGESQDYGESKLLPSLHRAKMNIEEERSFFEVLNDYSVAEDENQSYLKKAIDAQHYLQTSRLLDISFNVLIPIYFATTDNNKDAIIYVFCFPKSFSPSSNYMENFYKKMLGVESLGNIESKKDYLILRNNFKVITHGYYNERMKLQSGGFIFFPGDNIAPIPSCFYTTVNIPASIKSDVRRDLEKYFSIYESSVYPEKEKRKDIVFKAMKKNRLGMCDSDFIAMELNSYFEYLTIEIKSKIKNLKVDTSLSKDKIKKNIFRTLRKSELDLIKSIVEMDFKDKENKIKELKNRIKFDFEGLEILINNEVEKIS